MLNLKKNSPIMSDHRKGKMIKIAEGVEEFTVRKYKGEFKKQSKEGAKKEDVVLGAYLDTETTGLDKNTCEIIEIGICLFEFNKRTGQIYGIIEEYNELNQPRVPITEKITKITGITNEEVRGRRIDWPKVDTMLGRAGIILAHNASFDRGFVDKISQVTPGKIWGCSRSQVDWSEEGCGHQALVYLALLHGFFYEAHRAEIDVKAALNLLRCKGKNGEYYFKQILENSKKPYFLARALSAPFEAKEFLKEEGFRWNSEMKVWEREFSGEEGDEEHEEIQKIFQKVYGGQVKGTIEKRKRTDRFR